MLTSIFFDQRILNLAEFLQCEFIMMILFDGDIIVKLNSVLFVCQTLCERS